MNGVAIALVVASFAFTANLNRLADTPRLYGWDWTFKMGIGDTGIDDVSATMARLRQDPDVEAVALANYGSARIGGREVAAIGIESRIGVVSPDAARRPRAGPRRRDRPRDADAAARRPLGRGHGPDLGHLRGDRRRLSRRGLPGR